MAESVRPKRPWLESVLAKLRPGPTDDPLGRFLGAVSAFLAAAITCLGGTLVGIVVSVAFTDLLEEPSVARVVQALFALAAPGVFILWIWNALRNRSHWARTIAVGLCAAGAAVASAFAVWAVVSLAQIFFFEHARLAAISWQSTHVLWTAAALVVGALAMLAGSGFVLWASLKGAAYFASDEAKRFCPKPDRIQRKRPPGIRRPRR